MNKKSLKRRLRLAFKVTTEKSDTSFRFKGKTRLRINIAIFLVFAAWKKIFQNLSFFHLFSKDCTAHLGERKKAFSVIEIRYVNI